MPQRTARAASSRRGYLAACLKIVISLGLLAVLFSRVDVARLWAAARQASSVWLLGALALYGLMVAMHPWLPQVAAAGSFLVFTMSLVTLSFLVTTPEAWVGGFPYLSGAGRLVVKDAIMMGAALITMADSAQAWLRRQGLAVRS